MEAFLIIIAVLVLIVAWEMLNHFKQQKKDERNNSETPLRVNQPGKKPKSRSKTTKVKTSHESKPTRFKKKKKKPVKKKAND